VAPTTFATKSDAGRWLSTVEADILRGELLDPRLSQRTFNEWADDWLSSLHVRPNTRRGYEAALRTHVAPVLGYRKVAAITHADARRFVADLLASGAAPGTVAGARKVARLVLAEAVRADAVRRNPFEGVKVPRGERTEMMFLTADQVLDLADAISCPPRPASHPTKNWPAYGLHVRLAAYTGLRAGELGALRVGRVRMLPRRIEVAESVAEDRGGLVYGPPKTYEHRSVPIPRALAGELGAHLGTQPADPAAFVFTAPDGGPLRHSNFYRRHFRPAVALARLPDRTRFHDLRHTCAALLIGEGAHALAIKERLGHSSITVTMDRYGHLFPSIEAALTDRLDDTYTSALAQRSRS